MKMKAMFLLLLLGLAQRASANPYFRFFDPKAPHVSAGVYVDVQDPSLSQTGTALALVYHSPKDGGAIIPSMPVDWAPLTVGFGANAGKFILGVGPSANLAPIVRDLLWRGVMAISPNTTSYMGVKSILSPTSSVSDLSISFGPAWVVSPTENWKGFIRVQAGVAWNF